MPRTRCRNRDRYIREDDSGASPSSVIALFEKKRIVVVWRSSGESFRDSAGGALTRDLRTGTLTLRRGGLRRISLLSLLEVLRADRCRSLWILEISEVETIC